MTTWAAATWSIDVGGDLTDVDREDPDAIDDWVKHGDDGSGR